MTNWPTEHGHLPGGIGFYAYPNRRPNLLLVHGSPRYPVRVDFGLGIERAHDGGLRFDLNGPYDCTLEYHPALCAPASYLDLWGRLVSIRRWLRLETNWYLVQYDSG